MIDRPSDYDVLSFVIAFFCIMEPERRAELLALTERYATSSEAVDGIPHYSTINAQPKDDS